MSNSSGQDMAGRGGGGGKGAAGRMMSLQEFVSSMAPLIDLEKVFLFLSSVSSLRLTRLVTEMDGESVWGGCAGGGDNGGVRDERQEPGEAGLRHCQPQVHRCPGCCFGYLLLLLLGVIGMLQFSLQC